MKEKFLTVGFAVISLAAILIPLAAPSMAFAMANPIKSNVFNPLSPSFALLGPLTVCVGAQSANTGGNTLPVCSNLCDLIAQVANIIYYAIAVVIWIIAPILIAVGGIMIMLGGANPGMIERGKTTITGAIWGIAIVLCAWLIVFTFVNAFGKLGTFVGGFGGSSAGCLASPAASNPNNPPVYTCGANGGTFGTCPNGQACIANNQGVFACQ